MKKIVAVFGPSQIPQEHPLCAEAARLGQALAGANFTVLTGGYEGVMEAASRGAREAGGYALGVTAEVYFARGREANAYLTREIKVKSALDQTMELLDLADAYIALGNSTGTLVEVAFAWDYLSKKFLPAKPLLLVGKEWRELLQTLTNFPFHLIQTVSSIDEAVAYLKEFFGPSAQLPSLEVIGG